MNKKYYWFFIIAAALVAAFIFVYKNYTFDFLSLFIVFIPVLIIPLRIKERKTKKIKNTRTGEIKIEYQYDKNGRPVRRRYNSMVAVLGIFIFGWCCLFCLGHYFNPKKQVYGNYEHHALRIDGIEVGTLPFNLAGAGKKSFIDAPEISGNVQIVGFDSTGVRLKTKGLLNPLYLKSSTHNHENKNLELIRFSKGDVVELIGTETDEEGQPLRCKFTLNEKHKGSWLRPKDSTSVVFFDTDHERDTAAFSTFLKSGYPLLNMAADIPIVMDLRGISVVRDSINLKVKRREIYKTYHNRDYILELAPYAKIKEVLITGKNSHAYSIKELSDVSQEIYIPMKKSIYIGNGKHTSQSFKFDISEDKQTLYVKYSQPKYRTLQKHENSNSISVMVTTTILKDKNAQDGESGLIDNLTDHVLLFDLFDRNDNDFNIKPFYLSYITGHTNEKMLFSVAQPGTGTVNRDIPAGIKLPSVQSENGTNWLVSVENFKETTPFRAQKLSWILLVIIFFSALSMYQSYDKFLFTGIEYVCHLLIIALLSLRFFLLWRITVFPPVSAISLYEYEHLREAKWLWTPLACAGLFYIALIITKKLLSSSKFRNWCCKHIFFILSLACICAIAGSWGLCFFEYLEKKYAVAASVGCISFLPILYLYFFGNIEKIQSETVKKALIGIKKVWTLKWSLIWKLVLLYVFVGGLAWASGKTPIFAVMLPVFTYLCCEIYIYKKYSTSYISDIERSNYEEPIGERTLALGFSLINMLCASVVTLVLDGGYGVMFTMFALFSFWLKLADISQYTKGRGKSKWYSKLAFWLLGIGLVAIVAEYKNIFILLCKCVRGEGNLWIFFLVAWIIVLFIGLAILVVLDFKFKRGKNIWVIPTLAGSTLVVCIFAALLSPHMAGSHMEYRTRVHMESVGEILKSVDTPEAQNKFMQASLNDWILHEYQDIGKNIAPFRESGNGYFKIQPQSKLGAMWFAQTTDICLSRFIIAEHGLKLAWLLVLVFVVALARALRSPAAYRWSRIVSVQVFLLFALQALMILLANTRAFIFFGQDFPLISLTSRLSSIYFFVLAGIAVCVALIGKKDYEIKVNDSIKNEQILKQKCKALTVIMMGFFVLAGLFLWSSRSRLNLSSPKNDINSNETENISNLSEDEKLKLEEAKDKLKAKKVYSTPYYNKGTYDADDILADMNAEIDAFVNPLLLEYQDDNRVPKLRRNMSAYVKDFYSSKNIDSLNLSPHTKLMLNNFVTTWSKRNSTNNMIYLRTRRSSDLNGKIRDSLELVVINECYKYKLPGRNTQQWRGNLAQYQVEEHNDRILTKNENGHSYLYLPKEYSPHSRPILLMCVPKGRRAQIVSSDAIIEVKSGMDIVDIKPMDYIAQNGRYLHDIPMQEQKYIARRININENNTFVFPYGQKMFWARNEAARQKDKRKDAKIYDDKDFIMTVNVDLCNSIYDKLEANKGAKVKKRVYKKKSSKTYYSGDDRAIVVADGDGKIRAIVNHRFDNKYKLNPNDFKQIAEIADSLYLWGERGRSVETKYFGDFTDDNLRNGPGSSQKPILWTAVTAMFNTGWWQKLQMVHIGSNHRGEPDKYLLQTEFTDGNKFVFNRFAGQPIGTFRSIKGDEGNGEANVTINSYMYKSSNYYNAIIAYMGAFPKSLYQQDGFLANIPETKDGTSLFCKRVSLPVPTEIRTHEKYTSDYIATFPNITIGRGTLMFNRFISKDAYKDSTALAPLGLKTNFDLHLSGRGPIFNIGATNRISGVKDLNETLIRSVAIGNNTLWLTNPRKMAEMYGRLISMNKAYTLHLDNDYETSYEFFDIDESWGNATADSSKYKEYMKARKELIYGMSNVYSIGTGKSVFSRINTSLNLKIDKKGEDKVSGAFYIYGKTGTIDGPWGSANGASKEDHLLATIITDKKVSECSIEELKEMKFFVIYQTDYNYNNWIDRDADVIEEVLKSDVFREYMGIKK